MLYREIMAVCSEIHTKHIKTSQLMLYREIIAVCSEIHTKHINTAVWADGFFKLYFKSDGSGTDRLAQDS